ncbi:nucleotide-diphospho-sugar transferase family protein [Cucumis melo var. makuwa]|uniref:Glycosyltransferase n=1 Tax=Cucumis melo var. makuwa TaxID=1194695 RepID=A0A5A7VGT6_CUCMM|nr:nucleotide-diphospho-sugar transferase family protein [Cucumis melo var. makuwa]TYJ97175.1 nucleotide-diphospho-sugar transferase family protein [Cucumis melo var. makuwa]
MFIYYSFRCSLHILLLFTAISLSCLVILRELNSLRYFPLFSFSTPSGPPPVPPFFLSLPHDDDLSLADEYGLDKVLKDAATEDKTVILTTLNEAWAAPNAVIDLFLQSFRIGNQTHQLLDHLVIIALDKKAFMRCLDIHVHCVALVTEGVDFRSEAYFMSPDYLKMMWRRIDFLRTVLEMGYNFVFTDADVMWFRDPFPFFDINADFQIACDQYLGIPDDLDNRPNGGFNYVKSNNRSIEFYKYWYSARETYPGYHDQDVLNRIKYDFFIEEIGLKIRFLDTAYFGGFCEPSKDLNRVLTMHANCCIGMDSKLHDLRILLEDWKHYMSMPPYLKTSSIQSWRVPQNCRYSTISIS